MSNVRRWVRRPSLRTAAALASALLFAIVVSDSPDRWQLRRLASSEPEEKQQLSPESGQAGSAESGEVEKKTAFADFRHHSGLDILRQTLARTPWGEILVALVLALAVALPAVLGVVAYILCQEARRLRTSNRGPRVLAGQLVSSPYSPVPELQPQVTSSVLQLIRLIRICVPRLWSEQAAYLSAAVLLSCVYGLLACLVPSVLVRPLWTMVKSGMQSSYQGFVIVMVVYNALIAIAKAAANFCGMRAMIACRKALVEHLHAAYMNQDGRLYYTLGNLDNRVDTPDSRITNDTDLLMQFLFEFIFGGVMKPESGTFCQLFFLVFTVAIARHEAEAGTPGWGMPSIGIASVVVFFSLVPTLAAADGLTKAQERVQAAEAALRSAHAKCRLFAESICFYGGEVTESQRLEILCGDVCSGFRHLASCKLLVDLAQLSFYFGLSPISMTLAAFIVRKGEWTEDSETTFYVLNLTFIRIIRCCLEVAKSIVDLAKAQAMLQRVVQLLEVMDAFLAFEARRTHKRRLSRISGSLVDEEEVLCCLPYYRVQELACGAVVPTAISDFVEFSRVDIYTPDGMRLLLQDVSLRLNAGQSCLIMGPSGIGKSSLLRVLGGLWPLFRTEDAGGSQASFSRPPSRNVFFLAQRPYLFQGTLREQVAYPVWDSSLLTDLDDETMARMFRDANLLDVWEARRDELDAPGISWDDVLSLGEQQRLQFCRLFWHAKWHSMHHGSEGFFAVLDESTASMDTTSEMQVYKACRDRGLGYLSVAHRPTIIQFHTKVLVFEFDSKWKLTYRVREAKELALESAVLIEKANMDGEEWRPHNMRRALGPRGGTLRMKTHLSSMSLTGLLKEASSPVFGTRSLQAQVVNEEDGNSSPVLPFASMMPKVRSAPANLSLATTVSDVSKIPSLPTVTEVHQELPEDDLEESLSEMVNEGPAAVRSPYSAEAGAGEFAHASAFDNLLQIAIVSFSRLFLLAVVAILNLLAATMLAFWAELFTNVKSVIKPGTDATFHAFGRDLGIQINYSRMLPVILCWGPALGVLKALANYSTVLLMIAWRSRLLTTLQRMYLRSEGKLYYVLSNLDSRVEAADQRITNDVDLLSQFTFEFFLGGVMKPDSGVLFKVCAFLVSCCIVWMDVERTLPGMGGVAPGVASLLFLATFALVERFGRRCADLQRELQLREGAFRAAHARCRSFAEGISFYGGEETEKMLLDRSFQPVFDTFMTFCWAKLPVEFLQLSIYQGQYTIAMLVGGAVAFQEPVQARRVALFDLTNSAMVECLDSLNRITCQVMDFAKATALASRVVELYNVMQAFLTLSTGSARFEQRFSHQDTADESETAPMMGNSRSVEATCMETPDDICCCHRSGNFHKLESGELVPIGVSPSIVFQDVDIYTPDGLRLLLPKVKFTLEPGESCLIMGPSGIGKSSLLRVLGLLWPCFRTSGKAGERASFSRPAGQSLFFLAQRPYLFEGTLREQIAYPVWDKSLLEELSDDHLQRLFLEANLHEVWEARKGEVDMPGISWADVLSLGEQQRIQFCRLFWHAEWQERRRGLRSQSFFAVLDESTASMDTFSEMKVYSTLRKKKLGFLSVAHRPTVIQYHTKVIDFQFNSNHELTFKVLDARAMAKDTAALLTRHLPSSPTTLGSAQ
eukprot:TRINITY_DN67085_c0_g1_i1.p1 TRINITY_DN67085_c0_g1~~TRINITY_DN67085_c0_g1_i1.p1  ORF type:complete len:1643 (+),score=307.56 TRINITY_DN67085_c0_g1_i1:40-4968(+)